MAYKKTPAPFEGRRISVWEPQGNLRLLLFFANFATKNIMPKFSEMGKYQKDFRNAENEEFNLSATEDNLRMMRKSIRLSYWTFIVACLTLFVSVVALIVALLK